MQKYEIVTNWEYKNIKNMHVNKYSLLRPIKQQSCLFNNEASLKSYILR